MLFVRADTDQLGLAQRFLDAQDTQKYVRSVAGYSAIPTPTDLHPETSRRGTTVKRSSIKRKVIESRKKSKKAAKKDVTWKSSASSCVRPTLHSDSRYFALLEKSKDPGIPNNFPYKDQILAEIAEERRQVRPYAQFFFGC
jgi:hypothetical protein